MTSVNSKRKFYFTFLCLFIFITLNCKTSAISNEKITNYWKNLVIPLPKQMNVESQKEISIFETVIISPVVKDPCINKANEILLPFAKGLEGFKIKLVLSENDYCPDDIRNSLLDVPNKEQAYAISPIIDKNGWNGLLLVGNTPLGLLYAARTLEQLLDIPDKNNSSEMIIFPMVKITDWPDLEERGEWGGNSNDDLEWLGKRKMNVLEFLANLGFDDKGNPIANLDKNILDKAINEGIKPVPFIPHLEGLQYTGLYKYYPEVKAVPDPSKSLPTDWSPPIDFSVPKMTDLVSEWIKQILSYKGVSDVSIWLSEMDSHLYSSFPSYNGTDPYVMETKSIQTAFQKTSKEYPEAKLRILTTQTSYPVNNLIIDTLLPNTGISYYDGGRTYDTSHNPMIYPLLEKYSRSGRWLGVYPQLSGAFRTVFPFTSPQFMKERVNEFYDKKLRNMTGYTTPSNRYYEFSVTAAAEWSWNAKGRTPDEFAYAYAVRKGIKKPELYSKWATIIGKPSWDLAGSRSIRLLLFNKGQTFNPDGSVGNEDFVDELPNLEFGNGMLYEFRDFAHIDEDLKMAAEAKKIAYNLGNSELIFESESVWGAMNLIKSLKTLSDARKLGTAQKSAILEKALAGIDSASKTVTKNLYLWGMTTNPRIKDGHPSRFYDTVTSAQHAASMAWEYGTKSGIADREPWSRYKQAGNWNINENSGKKETLIFEITKMIHGYGQYDITFIFDSGTVGLDINTASILKGKDAKSALAIDECIRDYHIGRFERYGDFWVSIPKNDYDPDSKYFIKADITVPESGYPGEKINTSGRILFCKSWR